MATVASASVRQMPSAAPIRSLDLLHEWVVLVVGRSLDGHLVTDTGAGAEAAHDGDVEVFVDEDHRGALVRFGLDGVDHPPTGVDHRSWPWQPCRLVDLGERLVGMAEYEGRFPGRPMLVAHLACDRPCEIGDQTAAACFAQDIGLVAFSAHRALGGRGQPPVEEQALDPAAQPDLGRCENARRMASTSASTASSLCRDS